MYPTCALAMHGKARAQISFSLINARRAYTAHVGLYAIKTRDIIYEKQNISLARR